MIQDQAKKKRNEAVKRKLDGNTYHLPFIFAIGPTDLWNRPEIRDGGKHGLKVHDLNKSIKARITTFCLSWCTGEQSNSNSNSFVDHVAVDGSIDDRTKRPANYKIFSELCIREPIPPDDENWMKVKWRDH
ncbi:unnamed protein product [Ambrosiozyma monospora]|uniref:Unnamed protein product n=1 Tax=Ambrosiozyma monospora TaxID=43982 RepID=A0ACB5SYQ5_AMBMO|nr:unnamed protein product [Ambrosiozyma monospora]